MIFLFSTLKIQRRKKSTNNYTKNIHTKIKPLIHCIKNTYLLIDYVQGIRSLKSIYFWFVFFSIWRDSKILRSIILLQLPIILNWDRETRGPLQEWECSLIWEGEGLDRGRPVRTLTPACSAARVSNLRQVEPT